MTAPSSGSLSLVATSQERSDTKALEQSSCFLSGQMSGPDESDAQGVMTAERWAMRNDPDAWMKFLRATCANHLEAAYKYQASEKAARKWWEGVGSCYMDKVQRAVELHPREADEHLFGGRFANLYAIAAE